MTTPNRLWVLGAGDPEMQAIEMLLRAHSETYIHATVRPPQDHWTRVHPGNAYSPETVRPVRAIEDHDGAHNCTVYLVECGPLVLGVQYDDPYAGPIKRIDHHFPGDPGYGRPPTEFFPASSIGQVLIELARLGLLRDRGVDAPWYSGPGSVYPHNGQWWIDDEYGAIQVFRRHVLTAAADHCLAAAYRGECPGVDPDELMSVRAEARAEFQGRTREEVLDDIERTTKALRDAPEIKLMRCPECHDSGELSAPETGPCFYCRDVTVLDMRTPPGAVSERHNTPHPELPEAAARADEAYISGPLIGPDGRRKFTCSGSRTHVQAFMEHWAPEQGLVDIYGDPARGFAGGYGEAQ